MRKEFRDKRPRAHLARHPASLLVDFAKKKKVIKALLLLVDYCDLMCKYMATVEIPPMNIVITSGFPSVAKRKHSWEELRRILCQAKTLLQTSEDLIQNGNMRPA